MSATLPPVFRLVALALLELPVAVGLFRTATMAGHWLGCRLQSCDDLQGLGVVVVVLPFAGIVAIAYWLQALRAGTRWRSRLVLDGIALLLAIAGYVAKPL